MYECFLDQVRERFINSSQKFSETGVFNPSLILTSSSTYVEIISFYQVLCALEVAGHYDTIGKQLMQYITLFFPRHIKRFRAQRYADRVGKLQQILLLSGRN